MATIKDDPTIIKPIFDELKKNFLSQQTKNVAFRKEQIRNLIRGLEECTPQLHEALKKDLGYQNIGVTQLFAIAPSIKGIKHTLANIEQYARPRPVKTNLIVGNGHSKVVPQPYGVTLVIGSWNYPTVTAIQPAAEAIAAGNAVVLKPSELAPHCSNFMKMLFEKYLDSRFYRVIEGAVQVAINITTHPWDLIIFTGSPEKGKLVAKAAAQNLVPCILELGGKCPTVIAESADLENAAMRITLGKFANCGQTCLAPDFLFVHESVQKKLIDLLTQKIEQFYTNSPQTCQDYSRIIAEFHTGRIIKFVEEHKSKVIYGGKHDLKDRYVQPTLVLNPPLTSELMQEEIFGPVLPIITYKDFNSEVVGYVNSNHKPLALYYFGTNKEEKTTLEFNTSSGAFVTNECIMHIANPELPFGGVGNSGTSHLHGKWGFDACSHMKAVLEKDTYNGFPMHIRFPPYNDSKIGLTRKMMPFLGIYNEDLKSGIAILIATIIVGILLYPRLFAAQTGGADL